MNITITGNLGSGKSSICGELEKSGFEIVRTGTLFREIAKDRGLSVIELNELAKSDPSIDKMLDERSTKLGVEKDFTVFDSRMAWHFIPNSFKIFVLTKVSESAKRIFTDKSRSAEQYENLKTAEDGVLLRSKLEKERFLNLYQVNYYDQHNYNLVIDSTYASPSEVTAEILKNYELFIRNTFSGKTVFLNSENVTTSDYFFDFACANQQSLPQPLIL